MRVKSVFTVYPRKVGPKKVVYYYQTYDEDGRRTNGLSTGETTRTMAVKRCRRNTQCQIVPYFGKTPLNKITDNMIDEWLITFTDRAKEEAARNGSRATKRPFANYCLGLLSLMLGEAVKRGIIAVNPALNVKNLKVEKKQIEILTPTEVKKFVLNAGTNGAAEDDGEGDGLKRRLARMANILAFVCRASGYLTGMRMTPCALAHM